jgi:hypothetical protein
VSFDGPGGNVVTEAHLNDERAKIADLARLEASLAETVGRCGKEGSAPACLPSARAARD